MPDLNAPISTVFIREAFDCARRAGLDGASIMAEIADPDKMTLEEYGKLWFALAQEMEDEMLGTTLHPMRPGSFALLCHAILGAPTLGQALRRALWALGVMLGSPQGTLTIRNGLAHIVFTEKGAPASAFAYRMLLMVLLGPICWLARRRISLLKVAFRCDRPAGASAYTRFFGAPVQFGAKETCVAVDAELLSIPVNRSEVALRRFLKDAPGNLLVGYQGADDLTGQLRKKLTESPPRDWPTFEDLAEQVGMSPSTLRRQLKDQGTSFRGLKSELRQSMAKRLLSSGKMPIVDVAHQLGYTEPSAFFRAFQGWTGTSPAKYRADQDAL